MLRHPFTIRTIQTNIAHRATRVSYISYIHQVYIHVCSTKKPLFVTMVYRHKRPRLVTYGLNADVTATLNDVKDCLRQETNMSNVKVRLESTTTQPVVVLL